MLSITLIQYESPSCNWILIGRVNLRLTLSLVSTPVLPSRLEVYLAVLIGPAMLSYLVQDLLKIGKTGVNWVE